MNRHPDSQIPSASDLSHIEYAQVFTASSIWHEHGKGDEIATFDITIREMPGKRNFILIAGIEEIVTSILNWKYQPEYVDFLQRHKIINPSFADYLRNFSFRGDVWAVPEGTVVFPGEPVVRITAPLKDANLFTAFLTIALSYPTLFLTKAARVRLASGDKAFFVNGATRANSFENVYKATRLSYLIGSSLSMPYIGELFGVPKEGSHTELSLYHALIKSFPDEISAYRAILSHSDADASIYSMIDTYDTYKGLENFIQVSKEARAQGRNLGNIHLDSGDLLVMSQHIRKRLDEEGLNDVKICAESNLDEYKISKLVQGGAPIDLFGAVTEVLTVSDRPVLEVVYKLAEMVSSSGEKIYVAKLTPGKQSLPGKKQVFRTFDENGKIVKDIIGLDNESFGQPLLVPYIVNGQANVELPDLGTIKNHINDQLNRLPGELKDLETLHSFEVALSQNIQDILENLRGIHLG